MTDPTRPDADDARNATDARDAAAEDSAPTPGQRLLAARERLRLSPFDVARELKLHPRQIDALERDDYTIFSSPVFVRGFLRNYARLVGLGGDALVAEAERSGRLPGSAAAPGHAGGEAAVAPPKPGLREPFDRDGDSHKIGRKGGKHGIPAVVVLLAVAAGIVYFSDRPTEVRGPVVASPTGDGGEPPGPEDAAAESPGVASPSAASAEDDTPSGAGGSTKDSTLLPHASSPAEAPVVRAGGDPAPTSIENPGPTAGAEDGPVATAAPEPAVAPPAQVRRGTPVAGAASHSGEPEVRLAFSDESWVEVRDGSGKVVFSDLGQPGQERVVRGVAPFQVVVGKSSGVSLIYNSRTVDLAPYTQAEVARLTLQ